MSLLLIAIFSVLISTSQAAEIRIEAKDEDAFRKVGSYFMIREASKFRLICDFESELELDRVNNVDDIRIGRQVRWTFKAKDQDEVVEVERSVEAECKIYTVYKSKQRDLKKTVGISCTAGLNIDNMFKTNDGSYKCEAKINATLAGNIKAKLLTEVDHEADVALFVDSYGVAIVVVTIVILVTLVAIIAGSICCRWAGHRFAWEYEEIEKGQHEVITRMGSAEDAAALWHSRTRQMSNASNISGLVMHANDAEGMARLLERLDHMEDALEEVEDASEDNEKSVDKKLDEIGRDNKMEEKV